MHKLVLRVIEREAFNNDDYKKLSEVLETKLLCLQREQPNVSSQDELHNQNYAVFADNSRTEYECNEGHSAVMMKGLGSGNSNKFNSVFALNLW